DMSVSLSAERDRIQRQVEELEQSLSVTHAELELLSSETGTRLSVRLSVTSALQQPQTGRCLSNCLSARLSVQSELGLSLSAESCLQMNLVYQQVVQETLDQLEALLTQNLRQQKEVVSQLSGPIKDPSREQCPPSSCQLPVNMFLGRFLKPYFKDKLTGLGPPANQETKERTSRMTGCLDNNKMKVKRWESWQKTLLIHSVARDGLRRLIQPKLSKEKKEDDLIGDRYEEHDWQKISNVDFEGTRDSEDIRSFWQNFLHPSINKSRWNQEEVQQLQEVRHWESIAAELGTGRTAFLCLQTFQRFVSDSLRFRSWTPAEDALLKELVDKMRIGNFIPYTQMSYFMEGRGPHQLIYRWNQVLDPSLRKGPWTKEEDQLLLRAVALHGEKDWWKIRMEVPGRHDGACRDRYYDTLKAGRKQGAFDTQEKELLLKLVEKYGVGRWAKMAAEIPHRTDGQCLREWRKLTTRIQAEKKREKVSAASKKIRRRLMKLKQEEEEEMREEEEMVVEYMDSDEEEKKEKRTKMKEWTPTEKPKPSTFLSFCPVELPTSGDAHSGMPVRSTILGPFGRSVIMRHRRSALMMVTPDQLRAHLSRQAEKFRPQGRAQNSASLCRATDRSMEYELQAAITPLIGNLLIPNRTRRTAIDALRERGEGRQLSSTPVFLLLLQTMNVDSVGCKEMIKNRRRGVVFQAPPPDPTSVRMKNPQTIAGMLQQRKMKEEHQPPPAPHCPTMRRTRPEILPHMCPNTHHQLPPVFIPQPVSTPPADLGRRQSTVEVRASGDEVLSGGSGEMLMLLSSPCRKRSRSSDPVKEPPVLMQQQTALPGFCLHAGQSMWVMTHMGMVQLAEAPAQGLQVKLVPSSRSPAPAASQPTTSPHQQPIAPRTSALPTSLNHPVHNLAQPLPAPPPGTSSSFPPAFMLHPNPGSYRLARSTPPSPPKLFLPYKGTVRADPAAPPPLRREALKFDPSLMFLESPLAVCDWLSGRRGVQVLGAGVALPYLPPFVSSLSTLSALLRAKTALTKSALSNLLQEGAEEAELVVAVRQLVAERFSSNPAYQLLKARFLSCFTLPALLATIQPTAEKSVTHQANREEGEEEEEEEDEEEEEEEEEGLEKIKERGKQRRAEVRSAAD
uniref:Small nuclear RNA activating complex, polypeptide 4 n=1 Tax=Mola mola TaxID=94237 RepID=A0A3Q3XL33_MOLML